MKSLITKIIVLIFLGIIFLAPQKEVKAWIPPVVINVYSSYTNAPIPGVWVKWVDKDDDIRYKMTDASGQAYFDPWPGVDRNAQFNTWIDTNLDGINDTQMASGGTVPGCCDEFSCNRNTHNFSVVMPYNWNGSFTTTSLNLANDASIMSQNIYYTPFEPPTPSPTAYVSPPSSPTPTASPTTPPSPSCTGVTPQSLTVSFTSVAEGGLFTITAHGVQNAVGVIFLVWKEGGTVRGYGGINIGSGEWITNIDLADPDLNLKSSDNINIFARVRLYAYAGDPNPVDCATTVFQKVPAPTSTPSPSPSPSVPAWLKTSGGDVHLNQ